MSAIHSLQRTWIHQLILNLHWSQRTRPLGASPSSHLSSSWCSLEYTALWHRWFFPFGCSPEGCTWLIIFTQFSVAHRRSSKVAIRTVILNRRCLSGVNCAYTICVEWLVWSTLVCRCLLYKGSGDSFWSVYRLQRVLYCICLTKVVSLRIALICRPTFAELFASISVLRTAHVVLFEVFCKCDRFLGICQHQLSSPANSISSESALTFLICLYVLLQKCYGESAPSIVVARGSWVLPVYPDKVVFRLVLSYQVAISFSSVESFFRAFAIPGLASCQWQCLPSKMSRGVSALDRVNCPPTKTYYYTVLSMSKRSGTVHLPHEGDLRLVSLIYLVLCFSSLADMWFEN